MKLLLTTVCVLMLIGCGKELVYRADWDRQKSDYYSSALEYEKNLQKENIAGLQKKHAKAQELCYVLYNRSQARDQNTLLTVALKLYRLGKTIEVFEQMRKNSYDLVKVAFSREDLINKPLQMEFDMEMQDIQEFLLHLVEARVRIVYLNRFRQQALLLGDRQEERLENFEVAFQNIQNTLQKAIYENITKQFSHVGIAVTRDLNFKCTAPDAKYVDAQLDNPSILLPAAQVDVNYYEYYFKEEKLEFNLYLSNLKVSLDRLKKAIDAFKQHRTEENGNETNALADQLTRMTTIMDDKLAKMEKLFAEVSDDLKAFVGVDKEMVDKLVLAQGKQPESDEAAKKSNLDYYTNCLLDLSKYLSLTLYTGNETSETKAFLKRLLDIDKDFNQKQGAWSTGYNFLNQEWKEKVSFGKLASDFEKWLKQLEDISKDGLNPLWKTAQFTYDRQSIKPPYRLDNGYFKENNN